MPVLFYVSRKTSEWGKTRFSHQEFEVVLVLVDLPNTFVRADPIGEDTYTTFYTVTTLSSPRVDIVNDQRLYIYEGGTG